MITKIIISGFSFFLNLWKSNKLKQISFIHLMNLPNKRIFRWKYYPGRWLRITVFLVVTSPYTAVYDEIRHENGPYFAVILVTVNRHRIQHRILYRIRSYACRILITNGRKPPTWIPVKIRCVKGPYITVYGRICAVYVPYFSTRVCLNKKKKEFSIMKYYCLTVIEEKQQEQKHRGQKKTWKSTMHVGLSA